MVVFDISKMMTANFCSSLEIRLIYFWLGWIASVICVVNFQLIFISTFSHN